MIGFPLEKILTTSARDYVESKGKKLGDYNLVGIHTPTLTYTFGSELLQQISINISMRIEQQKENVEVVTDYKIYILGKDFYISATALVPKK